MGIISWIVLGLIAGFIASKLVNKTGSGMILDIVLGVVGAIVGGYISSLLGYGDVNGLNLYSIVIAVIGAVVVLVVYRAVVANLSLLPSNALALRSGELQRERLALEAVRAAADRGDRVDHASAAPEHRVGERDEARVGRGGRRGGAQRARDLDFVALGRQRAGGDEGRGGRTADAGVAMDQQRLGAVPAPTKAMSSSHMRSAGQHMARRAAATMSATPMKRWRSAAIAAGRSTGVPDIEQRDQRARAGRGDGIVDPRKRADMNARHRDFRLTSGMARRSSSAKRPRKRLLRLRRATASDSPSKPCEAKIGGAPKKARLGAVEAGERRRLEKGGGAVGRLDRAWRAPAAGSGGRPKRSGSPPAAASPPACSRRRSPP